MSAFYYYMPSRYALALAIDAYGTDRPTSYPSGLGWSPDTAYGHNGANSACSMAGTRPQSGSDRARFSAAHLFANVENDGTIRCAFAACQSAPLTARDALNAAAKQDKRKMFHGHAYDADAPRVEMLHVYAAAATDKGCYCIHNVVIGCGACNDAQGDHPGTYAELRDDYVIPVGTANAAMWKVWRG